jgi:hypothetical protein
MILDSWSRIPLLQLMALLEIGTAVTAAVLSARWAHLTDNPLCWDSLFKDLYVDRASVFKRYGASHLSTVSGAGYVFCRKHFMCHETVLPVGVLLSFPCQDMNCWMLHEQQLTIWMGTNFQEWTHVLLVSTPRSHLHSFCAAGASSGLVTRVTLTRVSRGRLVGRVYYTGVDQLLISFFVS